MSFRTSIREARLIVEELPTPSAHIDTFLTALADEDDFCFLDSSGRSRCSWGGSVVAFRPVRMIRAWLDRIELRQRRQTRTVHGNPFAVLAAELADWPVVESELLFAGGLVGYLGYDLRHFIERVPARALRDITLPDMYFAFYDCALVADPRHDRVLAVFLDTGDAGRLDENRRAVNALVRKAQKRRGAVGETAFDSLAGNFTPDAYIRAVETAMDYIAAGDIFQVNLSQRFECELKSDPIDLYRRLRSINPAPFAACLKLGGQYVFSSSPERFLKVEGRSVETRPIKGTRPRTGDGNVDDAMRAELVASEKDGAELAMIVDLERNDLGRVSDYGSVHVTEAKVLEEYASVFHLVATVIGRLHPRYNVVDLLRATFPGGSITGAPKVRAMEIIDELEPTARSVYTGAIGYISSNARADLNIVIRTFILDGKRLCFQVGGGIVADSVPGAEYDETVDKARALFAALGVTI